MDPIRFTQKEARFMLLKGSKSAIAAFDALSAAGKFNRSAGRNRVFTIQRSDVPSEHYSGFAASLRTAKAKAKSEDCLDTAEQYLVKRLYSYRKNAASKGLPFDLDRQQVLDLIRRSGGMCEVTGIPFDLHRFDSTRSPFAPSLDRINGDRGYVAGNVRVTCQIANIAMNVWGEGVLREFIQRARQANFTENFTLCDAQQPQIAA